MRIEKAHLFQVFFVFSFKIKGWQKLGVHFFDRFVLHLPDLEIVFERFLLVLVLNLGLDRPLVATGCSLGDFSALRSGEMVVQQDEPGNTFYIMYEATFEVLVLLFWPFFIFGLTKRPY